MSASSIHTEMKQAESVAASASSSSGSSGSSGISASRRPFVGGNWKMYGTKASVTALTKELATFGGRYPSAIEVIVAPTALHIDYVNTKLTASGIEVSAQNCALSDKWEGAMTGEISAGQLRSFGINWVILGHSERRKMFAETDAIVAGKIVASLKSSLRVIACLGETFEERKADQTVAVVTRQLKAIIEAVNTAADAGVENAWSNVVIAYEPVWAIGTGVVATPEQAQAVHKSLRSSLASSVGDSVATSTRIIYGGSVKADNCDSLFILPDVDGFLVGGASLIAADFLRILNAKGKILSAVASPVHVTAAPTTAVATGSNA